VSSVANFSMERQAGEIRNSRAAVDPVAQVVLQAVAATVESLGSRLDAIVLTGSAARGEATVRRVQAGWEFPGDCEFILVFKPGETLVKPGRIVEIKDEISDRLMRLCIFCPVGLSPVHPGYLQRLGPHINTFELKQSGSVVWGDPNILAMIPDWSASDISREDAWRLVCNRMIEQLSAAGESLRPTSNPLLGPDYQTVKLALDLATSFLIFCGNFAPSYQERSSLLIKLAEKYWQIPGLPFALRPFAELVQRLTCWKICPACGEAETIASLQPTVWDYARRLWKWELCQLTGGSSGESSFALMRRWMRRQPPSRRLQGWASLARRCGWLKSLRLSARWARLGWRASPRYWVYATAGELFLKLPRLMADYGPAYPPHLLQTLRDGLPVQPGKSRHRGTSWRQLAHDINWNYQHFLIGTIS
jgi:hypothetical protein